MKKLENVDMTAFCGGGGGNLKASSLFASLVCRNFAFTMAEILLSLTIIGVVAAITLPSLTGNINERTWNTQRKALYSRMAQAIGLLDGMRGYGTIVQTGAGNEWGGGKSYEFGDATEAFLSAGLSKVMKLNNICDVSHIADCGMPNAVIDLAGSKIQIDGSTMGRLTDLDGGFAGNGCAYFFVNGNNAAFETANGESVLAFYNPNCKDFFTAMSHGWSQVAVSSVICLNFLYDLNGKKGPNTVGKDVGFISVFYPGDPVVVAPLPVSKDAKTGVSVANASGACTSQDSENRLPNKEEFMAMGINHKFLGASFVDTSYYWTSSRVSASEAGTMWSQNGLNTPYVYWYDKSLGGGSIIPSSNHSITSASVRCIKRF